jgi:hypothetical protein
MSRDRAFSVLRALLSSPCFLQTFPVLVSFVAGPLGYASVSTIVTALCVSQLSTLFAKQQEQQQKQEQPSQRGSYTLVYDPDDRIVRSAAQWGSDVLGRVAQGHSAARAISGASTTLTRDVGWDGRSDVSATSTECELHELSSGVRQPTNHSSWIYNAMRSVTPEVGSESPRQTTLSRMDGIPEHSPFAYDHPSTPRAPRSPRSPRW